LSTGFANRRLDEQDKTIKELEDKVEVLAGKIRMITNVYGPGFGVGY